MLDYAQKRKIKSVMYNHITLYVLAIILLIVLHSTWSVYQKKKESEELRNISLQHVEGLRERDIELKAQINSLNTATGVEAEIRSKFNVAKDRENMVVVVSEDEPKSSTTTPKVSFWGKVKILFLGE